MNCSGKINRCSPIRSKDVNTKNTASTGRNGQHCCHRLSCPHAKGNQIFPLVYIKQKTTTKMLKQNKTICAFCSQAQENKTTGAFCIHVCIMLHFKKGAAQLHLTSQWSQLLHQIKCLFLNTSSFSSVVHHSLQRHDFRHASQIKCLFLNTSSFSSVVHHSLQRHHFRRASRTIVDKLRLRKLICKKTPAKTHAHTKTIK